MLSVGLRKDTVRIELQGILKDDRMSDEDLLDEVRKVVARDTEHRSKLKSGSGHADVNSMGASEESSNKHSNDNSLERKVLAELSKVSAQVSELAVVKEEIKELKDWARQKESELERPCFNNNHHQYNNGNDYNNRKGNWKFVKCDACAKANKFCKHCTTCGSEGHKRHECPTTKNN